MPDERPNPPEDRQEGPPETRPEADTGSPSFWTELKRRKVFRVASVYVITGWIIIQVASSTFENFGIPLWAFRFVALMVLLGLPVAVILTWAFELTPDGIRTTQSARAARDQETASPESQKKRNWMAYATGALIPTLIFGALAVFFYFQSRTSEQETVAATVSVEPEQSGLSIAMMPLINMSSNEENAFFAGGIHEDVLTNLSRIKDLQVISRTTMLRQAASDLTLPEIGEALGVDYIVEGSVRRIGNHVRVTVQLINAHNDHHLWASNYERELVDVFATQSELAREISNAIHLELQPESVGRLSDMPTTSVRAYDLYLKAISLEKTEDTTEENVLNGALLLEQSVEEDPDFVEAWALLKRRYDYMRSRVGNRTWFIAEGETAQEAENRLSEESTRALAKAIALDPDNIETRLSIAVDHVWPLPLEVMEKRGKILNEVIKDAPANAMARYHLGWWYRHNSPPDDANSLVAFEEALERDPFNARIVRAVLERYRSLSDSENVARLAKRLTEIVPETADDRRLALVHPFQRISQIRQAFLATADASLLADYALLWEDPVTWQDWENERWAHDTRIYSGMRLGIYVNDLDRVIQLSKEWELPETELLRSLSAGIYIHTMAMETYLELGAKPEAQAAARRIIDIHDMMEGRPSEFEYSDTSSKGIALAVLGDVEGAWEQCESLLKRLSPSLSPDDEATITLLAYLDLDRAVDLALTEIRRHPLSDGLDYWAARSSIARDFVLHPRIREYYLAEGKWIEFLAERVPEYAQYAEDGPE